MANDFIKEEKIAFDLMLEAFNDLLVASRAAKVTKTDQSTMERTGDIIWLPQPVIMNSYDGNDASANFDDVGKLAVPGVIDQQKHVPWSMSARELRDAAANGTLTDGAYKRLASDINVSAVEVASVWGSVVSKRAVAATGFDDISLAGVLLTEQGIPAHDRKYFAAPRDYQGMAANIAKPQTSAAGKVLTAYEKATIGGVAGFDLMAMDYGYRLTAAVPGAGVTLNGANQYYTPSAKTTTVGRGALNVDNRQQTITITVGAGGAVKVGDKFTIAGVNALHHQTKEDTGQLKTFTITEIVTGAGGSGTVKISPPIISAGGGTRIEEQYKNVSATPANGAAITFLNTVSAVCNPFFQGDALQILPGRLAPAENSGLAVMRGTTDQGFELVMSRQGEINDLTTKYRVDAIWGVLAANPEMMGVQLFSQS